MIPPHWMAGQTQQDRHKQINLLTAEIMEAPSWPNLFSSVVWECFTQQQKPILAKRATIWGFDQNISIFAFNTEKKLTVQTVVGKNPLLDTLRLLNLVQC